MFYSVCAQESIGSLSCEVQRKDNSSVTSAFGILFPAFDVNGQASNQSWIFGSSFKPLFPVWTATIVSRKTTGLAV
jgi:hypothetical protein